MEKKSNSFPMRLNKYLALHNYASRRKADELIEKGLVLVNGKKARIGDKITQNDKVEMVSSTQRHSYFIQNKATGTVVKPYLNDKKNIPLVTIDKNTHGLVIYSDDTRIASKINTTEIETCFILTATKPFRQNFAEKLAAGVKTDSGETYYARAEIRNEQKATITTTSVLFPIREICSKLFVEIADIELHSIANLSIKNIPKNASRKITSDELHTFLDTLHL